MQILDHSALSKSVTELKALPLQSHSFAEPTDMYCSEMLRTYRKFLACIEKGH